MKWRIMAVLAAVLAHPALALALSVDITVKETASRGVSDWPTSAVVPLAQGDYSSTSGFRLTDGAGAVPAQFQVLERWPDNSIRHVLVHFQATVPSGATKAYTFSDGGGNVAAASPVTVMDSGVSISVTTGPLKFTVNKTAFNLLDTVWYDTNGDGIYADPERIVLPSSTHGGRFDGCTHSGILGGNCVAEGQNDAVSPMDSPSFTIEESGPMRAVIRAFVPTAYNDASHGHAAGSFHRHGYAVRIYAYAGMPWVKVDYQLQNGATGPGLWQGKFAHPLYFNALNLEWGLQFGATRTIKTSANADTVDTRTLDVNGVEFAYTLHDQYAIRQAGGAANYATCSDSAQDGVNTCDTAGFIDISDGSRGVQAVIRNMWEMWPNGLQITNDNRLQIQLWPEWASQWDYEAGGPDGSGLYWLDDMRFVYKEVLLNFHGPTPSDAVLTSTARTFDRYPVPTLPVAYYDDTAATFDLGGRNQHATRLGSDTLLESNTASDMNEAAGDGYIMGWDRWYVDNIARLTFPCAGGDGPQSGVRFLVSESPEDFWRGERWQIGEMNARPEWLGDDYTHAGDYADLLPYAPYCQGHRRNAGTGDVYHVAGTEKVNGARDDAHNWSYHALDFYWFNANPWVKDKARTLGEFWRHETIAGGTTSERGAGHLIKDSLFASRVTGDGAFAREVADWVRNDWLPTLGWCGLSSAGDSIGGDSGLQAGFLSRQLANVALEMQAAGDWARWASSFAFWSALVDWNTFRGNYTYDTGQPTAACGGGSSSGTGWPMIDPEDFYGWYTGKPVYGAHADDYLDNGVPAGSSTPYSNDFLWPVPYAPTWQGQWTGRFYYFNRSAQDDKVDTTPPAAPLSPSATTSGTTLQASWSAPTGGPHHYLVVACDKPISESYSTNAAGSCNWWTGVPMATASTSVAMDIGSMSPIYVAVFAFDAANNMSAMSQQVQANVGAPIPPAAPANLMVQ